MSEKQTKVVPVCFLAWDYESEEAYINKNARAGWQLKKGRLFYHVYERSDVMYRYKLDYFPIGKHDGMQNGRYYDMFRELGWEYISSTFNGWNYFRKREVEGASEDEYEIYTDNQSLQGMLSSFIRVMRIMQVVLLCNLLVQALNLVVNGYLTNVLLSVEMLLGIVMFEVGVRQMKAKRVGKRYGRSVGIVGSYIIFAVYILLLFAAIFSVGTMFRH